MVYDCTKYYFDKIKLIPQSDDTRGHAIIVKFNTKFGQNENIIYYGFEIIIYSL